MGKTGESSENAAMSAEFCIRGAHAEIARHGKSGGRLKCIAQLGKVADKTPAYEELSRVSKDF